MIASLRGHFADKNLLFIDDGSTDGTRAVLEAHGVRYVRHPLNLGYKEALVTAFRYVLDHKFAFVVLCDADGQHRIEDVKKVVADFEQGGADMVLGSRYAGEGKYRWTLRKLGTKLFSLLTTVCAGVRVTDVTCGLKLMNRRLLETIIQLPTEDLHAELIVPLARRGAKIREVPIVVEPRIAGRSMYHFWKAVFYPARTLLCVLGGHASKDSEAFRL